MIASNLSGKIFGRLFVNHKIKKDKHGKYVWNCTCSCGNIKIATGGDLISGDTKSCGCLRREKSKILNTTHGQSKKTKEYESWMNMRRRCSDKNHPGYKYWGGRGITVCDEWKKSFETFFKDMGKKPSSKHSIDRINNDGNYEPSNCRWATSMEQASNKRPRRDQKYAI